MFSGRQLRTAALSARRAFSAKAGGEAPQPKASPAQMAQAAAQRIAALGGVIKFLAIIGFGAYAVNEAMVTIQPGHAGIIYNRIGGLDDVTTLSEGLNFIVPWFQRVIDYDVRTRPAPIDTHSGSKDLQMVQISLRVLFKPDQTNLPFIYRRLGKDFDTRVLPSIVNEVTKAVVAQYNASELLTKRGAVSRQIREQLVARCGEFSILVDDMAITHLAFSKEYTAAVEAKQVAQQDAERSKYIVQRAEQEKKSIIIRAEGEAQAATLIGTAISKNPAFLDLRRIEASREVANTVSSSTNKVYLNADTLMINTLGNSKNDPTKKGGW